jgi:transposase InsO family protein/transposase-like protein
LWSTKTKLAKEAQMREGVCPPRRMRFSFESRCRLVSMIVAGKSPQAAAAACGASRATGYRLWRRYREGGWGALADRPSTPIRQPRRLAPEAEQEILHWRGELGAGPAVIATIVERPASTVGKVLRRAGCSRLQRPGRDRRVRYERERPGELLHVDTKKLGRFWEIGKRIRRDGINRSRRAGWQHLHVAIDDHSRLAYCEILRSERKGECAAFLRRAVVWYAEQGITVERVLTDNAKAYHSHLWRDTCLELGVGRRYTRPYSPWTNGKAEALIKTLLREWAYRFAYPTSVHRARALPGYLRWYNRRRPHGSLGARPPISRVSHVCGQYS